jgi:hypothetical protein
MSHAQKTLNNPFLSGTFSQSGGVLEPSLKKRFAPTKFLQILGGLK